MMPSRSAAVGHHPVENVSRSEAASLLSDAIAEISGGSRVSMNGMLTIRNAAATSLNVRYDTLSIASISQVIVDAVLYPPEGDDGRCDLDTPDVANPVDCPCLDTVNAVLYPVPSETTDRPSPVSSLAMYDNFSIVLISKASSMPSWTQPKSYDGRHALST